ncbi:hypothetical protein CK505_13710 [Kocuria sp. WN036]|uniref:glycosyltransferase family 4 protein n=1 Tax=Kocuria sp. WN036 TaxID=2032628 RepID=UPI000BABF9A8|nr:glycosyltransferase family 4 protein [Kocuria sp. WN036]PAU89266.1 hypothetical protein CK505_13710 [Kocuria sp. WN036]
MKRVAIIHPWLPQYRLEFFELLIHKAKDQGVDIHVFHGEAPPEWRARGDAVKVDWATELPTKFISLGRKSLVWKSLAPFRELAPFDAYILEHAVRSLETYRIMAMHRRKVSFWGHGRTYTQPTNLLLEHWKKQLLKWSQWYFAYTQGGACAVQESGFPKEKVTVVQNSIDTRSLESAIQSVTSGQLNEFKQKYDIGGPAAIFIGGLDSSKRLDFLFEAGSIVAKSIPTFRLIVSGDGNQRDLVEDLENQVPWLKYVGPAQGLDKAIAFRSADVLCMPGRVGLVAVDSFAAGTPIVTTNWEYHAPEYEYLENGVNAIITADLVDEYASAIIQVFQDSETLETLSKGCQAASRNYNVEQMAENFLEGVLMSLGSTLD